MSRESMMEDAKRKTDEMLRTWDREDVLKFVAKTFLSVTIHGNNSRNLFLATIEYVPKSTLIERFLTQDDKPYRGKDSLKRNIDSLCYWVYEIGDSSLLSALLLYKHYNTNYRDVITELVYTMEVDGKLTTIGTVYMKKHHIVVELGGYKFKTLRMINKKALRDQYKDIISLLNLDDPQEDAVLFFRDKSRSFNMLCVVVSPNLVVTALDLEWGDDTHTIQDLYTYYKEKPKCKLI